MNWHLFFLILSGGFTAVFSVASAISFYYIGKLESGSSGGDMACGIFVSSIIFLAPSIAALVSLIF